MQRQALKNGNSAFVDEKWNVYPNQWDILLNRTEKLGIEDIEKYMTKWQAELPESRGMLVGADMNNRPKQEGRKREIVL